MATPPLDAVTVAAEAEAAANQQLRTAVRQAVAAGASLRAIAEAAQRSHQTIANWAAEAATP